MSRDRLQCTWNFVLLCTVHRQSDFKSLNWWAFWDLRINTDSILSDFILTCHTVVIIRSFLSSMTSSLKLDSMIYTDVMNIHGKFQQLRNSRKKVMDYHTMRESKTHKKWDSIERIKRNWSYNYWSWLKMSWSYTYLNFIGIGSIFGYKKHNINLKFLSEKKRTTWFEI